MTLVEPRRHPPKDDVTADQLAGYFRRLFPLHRSITGAGVRATHDILGEILPLERIEVASGTPVFDWTVPPEWVVREAYVVTPDGHRILDVADNNLHLLNYAAPFRGRVDRAELDAHLHSLPDQPDAIPYVTSYYERRWGFCIAESMRRALPEGDYEVVVDTEFMDGALTISEAVLAGTEPDEVLISTYTCHPSMANHELSGPLVAAFLYRRLAAAPRRLTYRFVFVPETIGSIAYLSLRGEHLKQHLIAGYVVNCLGLEARFTYKRSRRGTTVADRAAIHALTRDGRKADILDFFPSGSDERQYCSPGFDLPVGSIMRTPYAAFPEYHTSLDGPDRISFEALLGSLDLYFEVCQVLEHNLLYRNLSPYGEPNLGRRGLYPTLGAAVQSSRRIDAMMWLLNLADGTHDLLAIAERSGIDLESLIAAAADCQEAELIARVGHAGADQQ